jgi:hypothetical protein
MKNAADAARDLRWAIDGFMTKAGKGFPQFPGWKPLFCLRMRRFCGFAPLRTNTRFYPR